MEKWRGKKRGKEILLAPKQNFQQTRRIGFTQESFENRNTFPWGSDNEID